MKLRQLRSDHGGDAPGSPYTKPSLWARRRSRRAARKRARAQRSGARTPQIIIICGHPRDSKGAELLAAASKAARALR